MVQAVLAFSAVAVAALYVGWKFMPAALRRWFALRIGASMRRRGLAPERAVWLEAKLNSDGACGSCNTCNACDAHKCPDEGAAARMIPITTHLPES